MQDSTLLGFAKETFWLSESMLRCLQDDPDTIEAETKEQYDETVYRIASLRGQAQGLIEFLTQYVRN